MLPVRTSLNSEQYWNVSDVFFRGYLMGLRQPRNRSGRSFKRPCALVYVLINIAFTAISFIEFFYMALNFDAFTNRRH